MSKSVRYEVLRPCFVNGNYEVPASGRKPNYVLAPPGLEGKALKLAPERVEVRPPAKDEAART